MHHCFAPVTRHDTRLLLLGSLPGTASLEVKRYYAHKRNQFWRLIGAVIGRELVRFDYDARLAALLDAHIGLWDTVAAAEREGSLDAAIRAPQPSDLATLVASLPDLRAIGFNGGTAARIGRSQLGPAEFGFALVNLPSSSPAFAALSFERKRETWLALREFL